MNIAGLLGYMFGIGILLYVGFVLVKNIFFKKKVKNISGG